MGLEGSVRCAARGSRRLRACGPGALIAAVLAAPAAGQTVLRVHPGGTSNGDGSSWANAYNNLQTALAAAAPIATGGTDVQLWIASGTYRPASPGGPTSATFQMMNRVALYGGFAGTETTLGQRDPAVNIVVLSGDLNGDDLLLWQNRSDNVLHVVTATDTNATAVLDGLTITGGEASGTRGGGLFAMRSSITVTSCRFTLNRRLGTGAGGGAVAISEHTSNPVFADCTFDTNHATPGNGGAVWVNDINTLTLTGCLFDSNHADGEGGAVVESNAATQINDCTFLSNNAGTSGGAIAGQGIVCKLSTFRGNFASSAGAVREKGVGTFLACTFDNNNATSEGGLSGNGLVAGCVFLRNTSLNGGSGLHLTGAAPSVVNCTFFANTSQLGAALVYVPPGTVDVHNCVFWENVGAGAKIPTGDGQLQAPEANRDVGHCFIQLMKSTFGGVGNIGTGVLNARLYDTQDTVAAGLLNLRLHAGSPCIDAGDAGALPPDTYDLDSDANTTEPLPLDRDGFARAADDPMTTDTGVGAPAVDMGAYEYRWEDFSVWTAATAGDYASASSWFNGPPPADSRSAVWTQATGNVNFSADASALNVTIARDINFVLSGHTFHVGVGSGSPFPVRVGAWGSGIRRLELRGDGVLDSPGVLVYPTGEFSGRGTVQGTLANAGLLDPGTDGGETTTIFTVNGSYLQRHTFPNGTTQLGSLTLQVGGLTPGSQHDLLQVNGTAELDGTLRVLLKNAFVPDAGLPFEVTLLRATGGPINGQFDVAYLPGLSDGRFFRIEYREDGEVVLTVQPLSGDFGFGGPENSTINAILTAAAAGDLNVDGLPDLAVTTDDGFVIILFNAGNDVNGDWLGFSGSQQIPVHTLPAGVVIADFDPVNGNGNDLAVSNSGSDNVSILSRNGLGQFVEVALLATGDQPRGLAAAAFDGTASMDLAVANYGGSSVSMYSNSSGGSISFVSLPGVGTDITPTTITPFDPDNSKFSSSLITSGESGNAARHENNGDGTFDPGYATTPVGSGPVQVIAGDLNQDDLPDIVVVNRTDGTLSVIVNDGVNPLSPAATIPVGGDPSSITAVDVDLDGDLDLAVAALNEDPSPVRLVRLLRNDVDPGGGQLILAAPTDLVTAKPPHFVVHGDVDQDGREDIIAVNGDGSEAPDTVTTRINRSTLCPADFNRDQFVDGIDYDQFNLAFEEGAPEADFNKDGFVDGIDYDQFNIHFEAGC